MKNHGRENKALRALIKSAVVLMVALVVIIAIALIENRPQESQTVQREEAAPLVIEIPEPYTKGSIRVFDYDGCCIYAYYGEIVINNDGKNGEEIDIECAGYLEGYYEHGEPAE